MEKFSTRGNKVISTPLTCSLLAHQQDDSFESFSFKLPSGLLQDTSIDQKSSSIFNDRSSWNNYNCPADALFSNGKILPHAYPFLATDQVITSRTNSNCSSSKDSFVSSRSSSTGSSSKSSRSSSCNSGARRLNAVESNITAAANTDKKPCSLHDLLARTPDRKEIYGCNTSGRSRAPEHGKELKLKEVKVVDSKM